MSLFEIEKAYAKLDEAHMHSELKAIKDEREEEKVAQTAVMNQVDNQYWKSSIEIIKAGAGMFGVAGSFATKINAGTQVGRFIRTALKLVDSPEKLATFRWGVDAVSGIFSGRLDAQQMRSRHEQEFASRKASLEQQKKIKKNDALERQREQTARLFAEFTNALRSR